LHLSKFLNVKSYVVNYHYFSCSVDKHNKP